MAKKLKIKKKGPYDSAIPYRQNDEVDLEVDYSEPKKSKKSKSYEKRPYKTEKQRKELTDSYKKATKKSKKTNIGESGRGDLTHVSSRTLRIRPSKRDKNEYDAMMNSHNRGVDRLLQDAPKKKLKIKKKNR